MISSEAHVEEVRAASEDQLSFEAIGEEVRRRVRTVGRQAN